MKKQSSRVNWLSRNPAILYSVTARLPNATSFAKTRSHNAVRSASTSCRSRSESVLRLLLHPNFSVTLSLGAEFTASIPVTQCVAPDRDTGAVAGQ
jgi:hypothetical protein